MTRSTREGAEVRARSGFIVITAARFGGVAMVMSGFAIVRRIIDLPYALGAFIAVAGFFAIFFLPRFISRAWKAGDSKRR